MSDPGPGGPLIVSSGGSIEVAPDELFVLADGLRALSFSSGQWASALGGAAWLDSTASAPLMEARATAAAIGEDARSLAGALDATAHAYGATERAVAYARESSGGLLAWIAGFAGVAALPAMVWIGGIVVADAALAWLIVSGVRRLTGASGQLDLGAWLRRHPRVLNNPVTVAAVRTLLSAVDDGMAGAAHLPFPLARVLGENGLGLTGVASSALGVLGVAGLFGLLRETDVTVGRVREEVVRAPDGVAELLDRVPPSSDTEPQVRIERYGPAEAPDAERSWVVYIGGTSSWDLSTGSQPWDLTSDVTGMAVTGAGSERAVLDAMHGAGIRQGDDVMFVGHSQGGLIAGRLAARDDVNCAGIVTAGAPLAALDLPAEVPVLQIEHSDDMVPALAGIGDGDDAPSHVLVRREFLAGRADADGSGPPDPNGSAVPAHELTGYRETAGLIDASEEKRLVAFRERIAATVGAGTGTAQWWRGERVERVESAAPARLTSARGAG